MKWKNDIIRMKHKKAGGEEHEKSHHGSRCHRTGGVCHDRDSAL